MAERGKAANVGLQLSGFGRPMTYHPPSSAPPIRTSMMARITTENLANYLAMSGYVIMRAPPIGDFEHSAQATKQNKVD